MSTICCRAASSLIPWLSASWRITFHGRQHRVMKRQAVAVLDRCDIEDDTGTTLQHVGENRPIEPCRRHQANIHLVLSMVIGKRQDASIERGRASHTLHDDVDSAPLLPVFFHHPVHATRTPRAVLMSAWMKWSGGWQSGRGDLADLATDPSPAIACQRWPRPSVWSRQPQLASKRRVECRKRGMYRCHWMSSDAIRSFAKVNP